MKYILFTITITIVIMVSCRKVEVLDQKMDTYLDFENSNSNVLAVNNRVDFFYYPSSKNVDTVFIRLMVRGDAPTEKAYIKLVQDSSSASDVAVAVAGKHYVSFDDPKLKEDYYFIEAGQLEKTIPIIILRDISLQMKTCQLDFHIEDSELLKAGSTTNNKARITISDQLTRPTEWSLWGFFLGNYGRVKHQFVIDQSGEPWDNAFIVPVVRDEGRKLYYKNKFKDDLTRVNSEREIEGLAPLREDPNDPNTAVTFPN